MVTEGPPEDALFTDYARPRRWWEWWSVDSEIPVSDWGEANPADSPPEPVTPSIVPRTCVFCSTLCQVDLQALDGARIISEPALNIDHFVCAGCNHAT